MTRRKTRQEIEADGFRFLREGSCSGRRCGASIEWWAKGGKETPFNPMPQSSSPAVAHWNTCPDRVDFRR
jgi:hypothetical protein